MTTPIFDAVSSDLGWHPGELRPTFDLAATIRASYDRPRQDAPASKTEKASPQAARGRGRSSGTASTRKRAPRSTTTKKPEGDGDA